MKSGIFLRGRLEDPNQPEIVQQIAVYAQRDWGPFEAGECFDVVLPAPPGWRLIERAKNPKTRGIAGDRSPEESAGGQVVLSQRCMYMYTGISDDFSKAFPIALGTRPPASLPFFLADHDRVVGVRCQS